MLKGMAQGPAACDVKPHGACAAVEHDNSQRQPVAISRAIDYRDIRCRHAQGEPIEFAFEFGKHEANGFGSAGRSGNDRQRGGASATKVAVWQIEQLLIIRVRVNCSHQSFFDAEIFMQDFGEWSQTVCGAGSV